MAAEGERDGDDRDRNQCDQRQQASIMQIATEIGEELGCLRIHHGDVETVEAVAAEASVAEAAGAVGEAPAVTPCCGGTR